MKGAIWPIVRVLLALTILIAVMSLVGGCGSISAVPSSDSDTGLRTTVSPTADGGIYLDGTSIDSPGDGGTMAETIPETSPSPDTSRQAEDSIDGHMSPDSSAVAETHPVDAGAGLPICPPEIMYYDCPQPKCDCRDR